MATRIGIFGGSFDPVHYGHLILAETCREHLGLDRVLMIPAAQSPLKSIVPRANGDQRSEMLSLAVGGTEGFEVDPVELERGGVSYTIDTVERIGERNGDAKLFLMLGADSLASLGAWREPERILERIHLAIVVRGGEPAPDLEAARQLLPAERRGLFRATLVPMPPIGMSSTELRQRVAEGRSIRFRTPRAVEAYIHAQGLYRPPAEESAS